MIYNNKFTKEMYEKELKKDLFYLSDNFNDEIEQFNIDYWIEIYKKNSNLSFSSLHISGISAIGSILGVTGTVGAVAGTGVAGAVAKATIKTVKKAIESDNIDDFLDNIKDERSYFYNKIIYYCNLKSLDEVEVYKKAGLTRSIFSKIRSMDKTGYTPSKSTVISICLALELTLPETQEMLEIVGLRLSDKLLIDKIIAWCIVHRVFKIMDIDEFIYTKTGEPYFCKV